MSLLFARTKFFFEGNEVLLLRICFFFLLLNLVLILMRDLTYKFYSGDYTFLWPLGSLLGLMIRWSSNFIFLWIFFMLLIERYSNRFLTQLPGILILSLFYRSNSVKCVNLFQNISICAKSIRIFQTKVSAIEIQNFLLLYTIFFRFFT